jgi:hypothetical protein
MAHQEFGFQKVQTFIRDVAPWGHPDAPPKLIGKSVNVMLSPLPRNKRAKNPHEDESGEGPDGDGDGGGEPTANGHTPKQPTPGAVKKPKAEKVSTEAAENGSLGQNAFANLEVKTE